MNGLVLDMHPVAFVGKGQVVAGCIDAECQRHGQQCGCKQPQRAFHRVFHRIASFFNKCFLLRSCRNGSKGPGLRVPAEQQFQRSIFLRKAEQDIAAAVAVPVCGLYAEVALFRILHRCRVV